MTVSFRQLLIKVATSTNVLISRKDKVGRTIARRGKSPTTTNSTTLLAQLTGREFLKLMDKHSPKDRKRKYELEKVHKQADIGRELQWYKECGSFQVPGVPQEPAEPGYWIPTGAQKPKRLWRPGQCGGRPEDRV